MASRHSGSPESPIAHPQRTACAPSARCGARHVDLRATEGSRRHPTSSPMRVRQSSPAHLQRPLVSGGDVSRSSDWSATAATAATVVGVQHHALVYAALAAFGHSGRMHPTSVGTLACASGTLGILASNHCLHLHTGCDSMCRSCSVMECAGSGTACSELPLYGSDTAGEAIGWVFTLSRYHVHVSRRGSIKTYLHQSSALSPSFRHAP